MNLFEKTKIEFDNIYKEDIKEDGNFTEPSQRLLYFNNLKKLLSILEQFHDSPLIEKQDQIEFAKKIKETQIKIDIYKIYPMCQC